MARRTNQLNVDRLETRDLMAGNLSAVVSNGILFVKEGFLQGNTSNAVEITQLSNGQFRVIGLFNGGGQTTINGASFKDFVVPTAKLNVKLGGGDDVLSVINAKPESMLISMGAPNLADTDVVLLTNIRTRGGAFISTGGGADAVAVANSVIGDGVGVASDNLSIFTGKGADIVNVGTNDGFVEVAGRLRVATYSSATEKDADAVTVRSTIVGGLMALDTGAGNDRLTVENSFASDIFALTGTDDDQVTLNDVRAEDQFFVDTSHGNDTLDMVFLRARDLAIHGGIGFDSLTKFLDGPTGDTLISGWELINGVSTGLVPNVIGGGLSR